MLHHIITNRTDFRCGLREKKEKALRSGILSWDWQRAAVKPQALWLGKCLMTPLPFITTGFFGFPAENPQSPDPFGLRWQRKGRHLCSVSLASERSKSTPAHWDQRGVCAEHCERWVCGWFIGANQRWAVRWGGVAPRKRLWKYYFSRVIPFLLSWLCEPKCDLNSKTQETERQYSEPRSHRQRANKAYFWLPVALLFQTSWEIKPLPIKSWYKCACPIETAELGFHLL